MHKLYFTRHGETVWNVENKICGMTDSPLTERGRAQARALGQKVKAGGYAIDEILYSPLSRAADTAKAIVDATGIPARCEPRLREQCFGRYEGTPRNGEKFRKASENVRNLLMRAELILAWNAPLMQLTVYSCILLISWIGAQLIVSSGATTFTTGDLMSMLSYCMNILMSLMMLSMVFVMITMSVASAKRVAEVLDEQSDLTNGEDPVMEVRDGSVKFDHVSFAYKKDGEKALEDIDLDIKSGETIGIIGGTGSAKSSLVQLLPRLYDVTEGSVTIGGVDVRRYDLDTLRNNVAMVLQKNELFSGTIAENLRWGNPDATDAEIEDACKQACADEFIERFPDKYQTHIEQGGNNVSGGQKQRLCIARALLKKPRILILDDSTSAVDTATDAKIRHSFAEKIPGTTVFIIAQRISSVENADKVLVLDNGRVSGFDTPANLLKTNAIYQDVYNSQTKGSGDFDEKGGEA